MEYVKGSPYFCQTKTKLRQYPYLDKKLGIINAMYGVELLEDIFSGKENKFETLFSPKRE